MDSIPINIAQLKSIIDQEDEYHREMGTHCNKPHPCSFKDYCLSLLPEDSLRKTNIFHWKTRDDLIKKGQDSLSTLNLNDKKVKEKNNNIKAELEQQVIVDHKALSTFMSEFSHPYYFLDFECATFPEPRYYGYSPYEKIPFQFSLHILKTVTAELEHQEFLWDLDQDPSEACANALINSIGNTGSIIVYNASYEINILEILSQRVLSLSHTLQSFKERVKDIEIPFKKGICCIPGSNGYSSIKKILPLIDHTSNYDNLTIQSGDDAIVMYWRLIHSTDKLERQNIIESLKRYCFQDTMSMVKIYNWLENHLRLKL